MKGAIVWPLRCEGTWVWKEEFEVGSRLADVTAREAWVYSTDCDHMPFAALPELYRERVLIGKEGPGIVLKLAMNSCYGRCAQSLGLDPPFQSWVWAGNITSATRAQLLAALEIFRDPWDVLGFATDSVFSRTKVAMPLPRDTGTAVLVGPDGKPVHKPLGGWEYKSHDRGMFLMRPGVYFPMDPTEEDLKHKTIKARGMSAKVLLKNADKILSHWKKYGTTETITIEGLRRFVGLAAGISKYGELPPQRSERFGEWVAYPVEVSLAPRPKRSGMIDEQRLAPWDRMPGESTPYKKGNLDAEARAEEEAKLVLEDSKSGDFAI